MTYENKIVHRSGLAELGGRPSAALQSPLPAGGQMELSFLPHPCLNIRLHNGLAQTELRQSTCPTTFVILMNPIFQFIVQHGCSVLLTDIQSMQEFRSICGTHASGVVHAAR